MKFGRRKRAGDEDDPATPAGHDVAGASPGDAAADGAAADDSGFVDDLDEEDRAYEDALLLAEIEAQAAQSIPPRRPQGPWDAADAPTDEVLRIDLGGLRVPVPPDTEVRVDVTPEGEVFAATLAQGTSAVQINAFAAPRSEGIWTEVLDEIAGSLSGSGGRVERLSGPHGPELRGAVPTQQPGGGIVLAPVRFVGVDGPRWFLRAMYTGPAAADPEYAATLEAAVRDVVVVRGGEPMAVKDPLPLTLPVEAAAVLDDDADDADDESENAHDPLQLAERGPEITETR